MVGLPISSHFVKSGIRCRELNNIAEYNNLIVYSFSKIFEIRWSEFTHQLVEIILKSWNILMYFNSTTFKEARGFSMYLCNEHNLQLLCFIADVLIIFSRYQKKMQSDSTTICDIHQQLNNIEDCHIYIFNIAEYNDYSTCYSE